MHTPWKESYDQPRQHIKKQRHYFANQGPYSQSYVFSSSHVWMWGFPCGSAGKESSCNVGDLGLIPGLGRYPGERKGWPFQYSGLENSMGYTEYIVGSQRVGHWQRVGHGFHGLYSRVAKAWPSDFHFHIYGCELDHKEGWAPKNWCF